MTVEVDKAPVLLVDDSAYTRSRLRRFVEEEDGGTEVIEAGNGHEAMSRYHERRPRLVIIDQVMRGPAGIETAAQLLEKDPDARIVMLTVVSDPETKDRALETGILQVVAKNDLDTLRDVLRKELHGG